MASSSSSSTILIFCVLLCISLVHAAPKGALITQLPGFNGTFPSKHYSGYVTIDENHGRNLFYYFVVSEGNPSTDPLVLWLNGGPGCSSFDGFIYEHGPFNFEAGGAPGELPKLHLNPYSWSKLEHRAASAAQCLVVCSCNTKCSCKSYWIIGCFAFVNTHKDAIRNLPCCLLCTLGKKVSNIIYLDSPAGVGLSYSDDKSDYTTGDLKTASDTHTFLLKWFKLYPEFLKNPFFIAGESYAGVYVPTLAAEVVNGIKVGIKPTLNFKGYMVGNGVTDEKFDGDALVPFAHGMGLISNDLFQEVNTACQGSYWNPINESCNEKLNRVDWELNNLNIYDILEPCYHSPEIRYRAADNSRLPASFRSLGETTKPLHVRKRMFGRSWPLRAPVNAGRVPTWPELGSSTIPCMNDEVATLWLNNESVRTAIHAQPENVAGEWLLCTGNIDFNHDAGSMIKYHKNLTSLGYCAVIFSGDHDMCVPFTGSEAWTRSLGYQVVDAWRPWYFGDQVAGYTQGYEHNLIFLTIKGAGHTVPEYKPQEALAFYTRWLNGQSI